MYYKDFGKFDSTMLDTAACKKKFGIRRIPAYFLHLLAAVDSLALPDEVKQQTRLIYASHFGPNDQVVSFIRDVLTYPLDQCTPGYFSNGVFCAPMAYLTRYLEFHGSCLCQCGFRDLEHNAIISAETILACGDCKYVLLMFSDENNEFTRFVAGRSGMRLLDPMRIFLLTADETADFLPCDVEKIREIL